jgi:hypothetical protein
VPDIHYHVLHDEIALVVEVDRTQHAVELVLPQGCDHRLVFQRAGFLGRLGPHLNGSISVEGVTLWLETGRLLERR